MFGESALTYLFFISCHKLTLIPLGKGLNFKYEFGKRNSQAVPLRFLITLRISPNITFKGTIPTAPRGFTVTSAGPSFSSCHRLDPLFRLPSSLSLSGAAPSHSTLLFTLCRGLSVLSSAFPPLSHTLCPPCSKPCISPSSRGSPGGDYSHFLYPPVRPIGKQSWASNPQQHLLSVH